MQNAKRNLEKYGWKEGRGLGKGESGIAHSIKVPLKQDTAGIGFNPSQSFTSHWWTDYFNETAKSITVEHSKDGVCVSSTSGKVRLGKRNQSRHQQSRKHPLLYRQFVKAAREDDAEVTSSCRDQQPVARVSDVELLKACEGRTAHKGARHGLKQNGKLWRLEEQEKQMESGCSDDKE